MAKIPLRTYNSEIEKLIENKQNAEAIAHCKHILKFFPKHIDTYRLLGKAYLENRRYSEAADILQRVLSVIPDDFLSQVGMSMVREDEGNLDAALYHMERAYEIYPANPAIQEELRRLYGRRDGVEPPKIRLTRGALVRLYDRGALFPQAIAEARAALAEDAQRVDLQVLLARLYFRSGQKVQAAEISNKLVAQLPYCYEANRILADVLPGTSLAEEAKIYQERIQALDPYAAMIGERGISSAEVPDNAVQVERLEYQPGQEEDVQPDWARNVGVAWDSTPAGEPLPDWMAGGEEEPPATPGVTAEETPRALEIPDWMAAAGWAPSDGEETAPAPFLEEDLEVEAEGFAAPAEIPDWLQAMSPPQAAVTQEGEVEEDKAWLDGLMGGGAVPNEEVLPSPQEQVSIEPEIVEAAAAQDVPDWLQEQPETPAVVQPGTVPDWLSTFAEESSDEAKTDVPEWLNEQPAAETPRESAQTVPEWLSAETSLEAAQETDQVPDWLKEQPSAEAAQARDQVPDWLSDTPETPQVEQSTDAVPDWLQLDNEAPQAQLPEAFAPSNGIESMPSPDDGQETIEEVLPDASAETAMPHPEDDMDAAMAWLEALAAKQGAEEGTLTTAPDARSEVMPDWVKQEAEAAGEVLDSAVEDHQAETLAAAESAEPIAQDTVPREEITEIVMESTVHEEPVAASVYEEIEAAEEIIEVEEPETPVTELPAFQAPDNAPASGMTPDSEFHSILPEATPTLGADQEEQPVEQGMDDAFAWLESLAARQGADEGTLLVEPEARSDAPPDWVTREAESMARVEPAAEETLPSVNVPAEAVADEPVISTPEVNWQPGVVPAHDIEETLPEWLQGIDEYAHAADAEQTIEAGGDALPDWLQGLESMVEEESQPEEHHLIPVESAEEWQPESETPPVIGAPEELEQVTELEAMLQEMEAQAEPVVPVASADPVVAEEPPQEISAQPAVIEHIVEQQDVVGVLATAQQALSRGEIAVALEGFNQLISEEDHLEEVIHDLRDASYRYPVNSDIWQALGDAYSRSNRIQEALDAYTKAEELLR